MIGLFTCVSDSGMSVVSVDGQKLFKIVTPRLTLVAYGLALLYATSPSRALASGVAENDGGDSL